MSAPSFYRCYVTRVTLSQYGDDLDKCGDDSDYILYVGDSFEVILFPILLYSLRKAVVTHAHTTMLQKSAYVRMSFTMALYLHWKNTLKDTMMVTAPKEEKHPCTIRTWILLSIEITLYLKGTQDVNELLQQ